MIFNLKFIVGGSIDKYLKHCDEMSTKFKERLLSDKI